MGFTSNYKNEINEKETKSWMISCILFNELINEEHFEALMSDAFWYFICSVIKPDKKYEAHNEFLLDRMAANYVSYSLFEKKTDSKKIKNVFLKVKNEFFDKFYNHLAQGVY